MTAFVIQTLLLCVPAFFIGAALACALRRALHPTMVDVPVETLPAATAAVVAPAVRAAPIAPPAPTPAVPAAPVAQRAAPVAQPAAEPVRTVAATPVPAPTPAPAVTQVIPTVAPTTAGNRFDDSLKAKPVEATRIVTPEPTRVVPPPPAEATTLSTLARAAEAAASGRVVEPAIVSEPIRAATAAAPPAPPAAVVVPPSPSPTLSTLARTSEVATAAAAATAAVAALAEAARARVPDVASETPRVTETPRAPVNAATNAAKSDAATAVSQVDVKPGAPAGIVVPVDRAVVVPSVAAATTDDDLTRINGIDAAMSDTLGKLGISRFAQIAAWRRGDIDEISRKLGFDGRIEQQNWIEQAQVLAGGGDTQFSSRRERLSEAMATAPDVRADAATSETPSVAPSKPVTTPDVSGRAAFATVARPAAIDAASMPTQPAAPAETFVAPKAVAAAAVVPTAVAAVEQERVAAAGPPLATPIRPAAAPDRDALERVRGISPEIERLLNGHGVTRYSQIASWLPADIERFDRLLGSDGRIVREQWIEQAQMLAKGGDTSSSRAFDAQAPERADSSAPAPRPIDIVEAIRANTSRPEPAPGPRVTDMSAMRSVRSAALLGRDQPVSAATAAAAASDGPRLVRSADTDDLKRIRGIGVLIEKRLNGLGIVSYAQIADWTRDDVDRVNRSLDFKGRIEREHWVEQARILTAGGHTEFSRRVDRGEVETPRAR